jgi:hypothetical protein
VSSQQLQGQLWTQHSVDTVNYITDIQKHVDNSHGAGLANTIVEKSPFIPYTTKKCIRPVIRRKMVPVNSEVVLRTPIKVFNDNSHSMNDLLLFI